MDAKASGTRNSISSRSTLKTRNRGVSGFTTYFRRKNQRAIEKKEQDRLEAAERLRKVLQPVQFSVEEEERLKELKQYKKWKTIQRQQGERQREIKSKAMPPIPESRMASLEEGQIHRDLRFQDEYNNNDENNLAFRAMSSIHQHTWEQRIAIVSTLMVLLFFSLHADIISRLVLPEQLFLDNSLVPWYIIVLKDCGTFCHMTACSLIHFALCDISMIYAFESMELGTKTGPKVKQYYRQKVHLAVAAVSGGIVAFSICKALVLAWFRMLRELLETAIDLVSIALEMVGGPSNIVVRFVRLITGLFIWIVAIIFPFHEDERPLAERVRDFSVENITNKDSAELVSELEESLEHTLNQFIESPRSTDEPPSWRDDAFATCHWLLSHSAFFVVTVLVSMHFLTSSYRHKRRETRDDISLPAAIFPDDHSSILTSPSLSHEENALTANFSDTSMETQSTTRTRPRSITVTIAADSVGSSRY